MLIGKIIAGGLGLIISGGIIGGVLDRKDKLKFDQYGYNKHGFDAKGYDRHGFDKKGYNKAGYNKDGTTRDSDFSINLKNVLKRDFTPSMLDIIKMVLTPKDMICLVIIN